MERWEGSVERWEGSVELVSRDHIYSEVRPQPDLSSLDSV